MADTSQCDFCSDINALDTIMQKYNTVFDDMMRQQNEIEEALSQVQESGCLKGQWYDAFMESYTAWSENYSRVLASLIIFCASLSEAKDYTNYLIEQRDALEGKLGA